MSRQKRIQYFISSLRLYIFWSFAASVTLSLDVAVGRRPSVVDGGSVLVDDSSKIFTGGELELSGSGNASSGCVLNFNTAFKVKFGLPSLAFLPKWYWKMYLWPSTCDSMLGTWYVSLSSTELTTELQSCTKSFTWNCFLLNINGSCKSRFISGMRGRKTFSDVRVPVMMRASMTLSRSYVTISRVPLHRPAAILRLRSSMIGAPTFNWSICGGKPEKFSVPMLLSPMSKSHVENWYDDVIDVSIISGLKAFFLTVLPDGNNKDAIPQDATVRIIFSSDHSAVVIAFQRNVFPVPP
nr:hypothetical protein [Tanacetum cinerariifolium]